MRRSILAAATSTLLTLTAATGASQAAEGAAAGVLSRGMTEVCTPWNAGADKTALFASLKADGWNVDLLPRLEGPWGTALFQIRMYDEKRGCNAMLTLTGEGETAAATKAALDWVAGAYPRMPMTNQNKPVQIKSGPVHAWTWADETTAITFYAADKVVGVAGPHVVLSIKPR